MTDTTTELTTIEQTVRIAASPETVWSLWTEPDRIVEWMGDEAEMVAQPGGAIRVALREGVAFVGEFVEVDPPHRLVFTFGWEGNQPGEPLAPGSTRVEVILTAEGDETVLVLRHCDMPATHAADHLEGWKRYIVDALPAVAASTK